MNSKFVIRNETAADISAIDIKCRSGRDGGTEDEA